MMTVKEQQCFLGGLGYYTLKRKDGTLAIDSITGQATRSAIYNFQVQHKQRPDGTMLVTDGVWGPATEKALREVIGNNEPPQENLDPHPSKPGRAKIPDSWRTKYPYLNDIDEILCQCNGEFCNGLPDDGYFDEIVLGWANEIGRQLGVQIKCTSGYRCHKHNAQTPGASPNSKHKLCIAMDLQAVGNSVSALRLYNVADALIGDQGGVGIYSWGIHIDHRGFRSRWDSR